MNVYMSTPCPFFCLLSQWIHTSLPVFLSLFHTRLTPIFPLTPTPSPFRSLTHHSSINTHTNIMSAAFFSYLHCAALNLKVYPVKYQTRLPPHHNASVFFRSVCQIFFFFYSREEPQKIVFFARKSVHTIYVHRI